MNNNRPFVQLHALKMHYKRQYYTHTDIRLFVTILTNTKPSKLYINVT